MKLHLINLSLIFASFTYTLGSMIQKEVVNFGIDDIKAFDYAKKFNNPVIGTTFFLIQIVEPLYGFLKEVEQYKTISGTCGQSITPFWLDQIQNLLKIGEYSEEKSDPDIEFLCTRFIWSVVRLYNSCDQEVKIYDFSNYGYHSEIGDYLISYLDLGNEYTSVVFENREVIAIANDDFSALKFKHGDLWYEFNGTDSVVRSDEPVRFDNSECTIISKAKSL